MKTVSPEAGESTEEPPGLEQAPALPWPLLPGHYSKV